jgi:cytochrome c-type biogenesis protein CcmH/NrfF
VEILLWLVPAAVATAGAALWAAYAGREAAERDDPDVRLTRIGEALHQDPPRSSGKPRGG